MSPLAGFGVLLRSRIRQDRVRISLWVWLAPLLTVGSYASYDTLFPDETSRQALVTSMSQNPAVALILGPGYSLDTAGGFTTWRSVVLAGVLISLMVSFTVIRHTRLEEDTGRAELIYSGVVGRHAQLAATMTLTMAESIATGAITTGLLVAFGADLAGAAMLGAAYASIGITFTAVAGVSAQVGPLARVAVGITVGVIGIAYLVRAFGDASSDARWVSMISPFGWALQMRAFAENRWELLAVPLTVTLFLVAVAHLLLTRRDVAMGLIAPGRGRRSGGWQMSNTLGLAHRLQAATLNAWLIGFVVSGLVFGSLASSIDELLADSGDAAALLSGSSQELGDAFITAMVSLLAVAAAAYGTQAVLRARAEEEAGRAEPVLSAAVSRRAWFASHIVFGVLGSTLLMCVGGAALALTASTTPDATVEFGDVMANSLVHVPAVWVLVGLTCALAGLLPRISGLMWLVLGASFVITFLGPMLDLPDTVMDSSPFTHVPSLTTNVDVFTPTFSLVAIFAFLLVAGMVGIRIRDIHTT